MRQSLNYARVLDKLVGLLGQEVLVGISGADRLPPQCANFGGELQGAELYGGDLVGYDKDALSLHVGEVMLTLHPDHFVEATWEIDGPRQNLRLRQGNVIIQFRAAAPAPPATP